MPTKLRWMLALGAIVALALTVSACGSDDDSSSSESSSASSEHPVPACHRGALGRASRAET